MGLPWTAVELTLPAIQWAWICGKTAGTAKAIHSRAVTCAHGGWRALEIAKAVPETPETLSHSRSARSRQFQKPMTLVTVVDLPHLAASGVIKC